MVGWATRTVWAIAGALSLALVTSCVSTAHRTTTDPAFATRYSGFSYAEVEAVRQSEPRSCGLAVLACLLRYWDRPVNETDLLARHPIPSGAGHSLQSLREIAESEGVLAFALSLNPGASGSPAAQLSEQIAKGRPIIVAVRLPQGRYFGDPVPVLGTVDARTLRPFGLVPSASGQEFKLHYVVVFGEDATRYLLMDPAYGIVAVPKASLLQWWKDLGYAALLCSPPPTSITPSPSPAP
ncbi:MAG: cysteine peptidase family C39 domain-containing protein [Verrucomicrobiales bacterium]